jgi:hypothetical protein
MASAFSVTRMRIVVTNRGDQWEIAMVPSLEDIPEWAIKELKAGDHAHT